MNSSLRSFLLKSTTALLAAGAVFGSANGATLALQDVPLYLLSRADPNVLLNMSVETPMGGAAYTDQVGVPTGCAGRSTVSGDSVGACYFPAYRYIGYFNPEMCYTYDSAASQFNTSSAAGAGRTCSGAWSGNFLNWASMTAIDMFIRTMTGGNRIVDTATTNGSVVRRARKTNNDSWFPIKYVNSGTNVAPNTVTPYSDATLYIYNTDFGFNVGTNFADTKGGGGSGFKASFTTAVRVCTSTPNDDNCVSYGTYSKPEGAIQRNARTKRFGAISYSTDGSNTRDGGILRSNMKYVGPTLPDGSANSVKEFNTDGTLVNNPDGAASGLNSGVINYINKFSDAAYKSLDPVSELFYESIRYFKHLGPTPEYSAGLTTTQLGGFQAVNSWTDPQQFKCQKNFIIAINDANPWLDKRLPGTFFTSSTISGASGTITLDGNDYGEPSNADHDINVTDLTNRVGAMEGLNGSNWANSGTWTSTGANGSVSGANDSVGGGVGTFDNGCSSKTVSALGEVMGTCPFPGKQNSYYVAGLAYYANTTDLRPDFPNDRGIQNVQTFMIDTQEFNSNPLDGPKNMLWLTGKYGGFVDANNDGVPQATEWDADGDGSPDNYVLATQPQNLVNGLDRAFDFIEGRVSSASSASVNSGSISDLTRIYQTRFNSGTWTGQLLAFAINADGTLGDGVAPLTDAEAVWDAGQELPGWNSRQIITRDSTGGKVAFRWASLDATRQSQLGNSSALLDYLRGNGANEGNVAGQFRPRLVTKLGDIVSSAPLFVGRPPFRYRDTLEGTGSVTYATFVAANDTTAERQPMVYAGANDGMLHGFNATTGAEIFAFIPTPMWKTSGTPALARLTKLALQNYQHEYFVDGPPSMGDAYWSGAWHTVIAGGLNKGGQGIYALDVTSTSRLAAAEGSTNAANTILWEFTDANDADLGYTFSQPAIFKSHDTSSGNGRWVVGFGNGYNSTLSDGTASSTGNAVLFIRDAATGSAIAKIDTGVGNAQRPAGVAWDNGLSTPSFVDIDADHIVDYAYAGDLYGNMWKFDLRNANPANWSVAYVVSTVKKPLFTAVDASGNRQPITERPEVTRGPKGAGMVVLFGTGKYLEPSDLLSTPVRPQSFYGILDQNTGTAATDMVTSRSPLTQQTILSEVTFDPPDPDGAGPLGDPPAVQARITSNNAAGAAGWYIDLVSPSGYQNEKQVTNPIVRNGHVIFTTTIPETNPCSGGGRSWIMELDALDGSRLEEAPFDLNRDGKFDDADLIPVDDGAGGTMYIPPSGLGSEDGMGILQTPGVVDSSSSPVQYKYSPGSSGSIQRITENPGAGTTGRQSWRQIR
ncbi:MAG TPA: PilC/PilY family type IV pilus protein [Steroidobacteraceae bacterium]